jgi:hypothetical protein
MLPQQVDALRKVRGTLRAGRRALRSTCGRRRRWGTHGDARRRASDLETRIVDRPAASGSSPWPGQGDRRGSGEGQRALDAVLDRYPGTASRPKRLGETANYTAAKTGATDVTIQTLNSNCYLDAKSRGDYRGRPHGMLARACECYRVGTLKHSGRGNSYLAFDANRHDRNLTRAPYPQADERERIGTAFDKLFDAIRSTGAMQKALAAWSGQARQAVRGGRGSLAAGGG